MMSHTKIQHYYALEPYHYPILERMEVHQPAAPDGELPPVSLHVTLRPHDGADMRRLTLRFSGVSDFCFTPCVHPFQFTVLEMASMEDRQWEHIAYRVTNAEQDTKFHFYCLDFTAELKSVDAAGA